MTIFTINPIVNEYIINKELIKERENSKSGNTPSGRHTYMERVIEKSNPLIYL